MLDKYKICAIFVSNKKKDLYREFATLVKIFRVRNEFLPE